jgi:outer membrane lipoprotein-sorting protein
MRILEIAASPMQHTQCRRESLGFRSGLRPGNISIMTLILSVFVNLKHRLHNLGATVFAVVLTFGLSGQVHAQELTSAQADALERMTQSLNALEHMAAKFVQVGPDGSRLEGRVYLQRPGKVRFEYNPPEATRVISNGLFVAVQDSKLNTLQKYPLAATPLKLILARSVDLNRDARIVNIMAQPDFATVTVEARGGDAPGQLTLMFDGESYALKQWTVTDAQGLDTSVALLDINHPESLPARLFRIIENRVLEVD